MAKAQRPKQFRPHTKMAADESYGAVCKGKWNFDPIASRRPQVVWQQLEKATNRTRKELRDMGWEVKRFKRSELPPRFADGAPLSQAEPMSPRAFMTPKVDVPEGIPPGTYAGKINKRGEFVIDESQIPGNYKPCEYRVYREPKPRALAGFMNKFGWPILIFVIGLIVILFSLFS